MSQYEIAKLVFESDSGITVQELKNRTGHVESTIRTSLIKLIRKDLVDKIGKRYIQHPNADEKDLEAIRPPLLRDILE